MHSLIFFIMTFLLASCSGNSLLLNVNGSQKSTIASIAPLEASAGDTITIQGTNLVGTMSAVIGDKSAPIEVLSSNQAQFILPEELANGIVTVTISKSSTDLASFPLYNRDSDFKLPPSQISADKICDTTVIRNAAGEVIRGNRFCGERKVCDTDGEVGCVAKIKGASVAKDGLALKIMTGSTIAGVAGSALHDAEECNVDGEGACKIDGVHFKAAKMQGISASDIRQGVTIAGIAGSITGEAALCAADGDMNCRALAKFPATDRIGTLTPFLSSVRSSFAIAGATGLLPNCSHDGETECIAVAPGYAAALATGTAGKILLGQTVATVDGAAAVRPVDCSSDAQTGCTTVPTFPAVKKADLISNAGLYKTSLSLAGLPGSLASCNTDGQTTCVTVSTYPAADKAALQSNAAKFKSSLTLASVAGTLADCATDGTAGCVAVSNFPAAAKTGAAPKIASSQTLAGTTGTGATKPVDCATDGQTNCTAVAAYPAMVTSGSAPKILTGQTLGGVAGSATIRPTDCATDGGTNCIAVADYPAFQASNLSGHLNKISTSVSIAGQAGTLQDCADGDFGCRAVGPSFAAASTTGLAPKIVSGQVLAGTTGTGAIKPTDCATDGGTGCTAIAAYPAAQASIIAMRTIDISSLGAITGTAATPRPLDCSAEAATNCVSVATYPAMKVLGASPKIQGGQTVGGVSGTGAVRPANCSTDNATECVAVSGYPAVDKSHVQSSLAKIGSSLSIAGLSGSLIGCSTDGGTGCITSNSNPATQVVGAAAKILTGQSVAGVAGTAANTPAACAASGASGCVTSASYPSINKSTVTGSANKMKTSLTLLGVTGTLPDCSADAQTACVATAGFPAAATAGAAAKIMNLQTLAGVSGTAPVRPADCAADGSTDCTTVTGYPSVNKSTIVATKIRRNTTIATVAGTLDDCAADGATGCVSIAAYPAALASGAAAKVMTGQTLAGATGTAIAKPADCSAENVTDCVAVTAYPAISTSALTSAASSLRSGTSILSTSGTLADCSADGGTTCVTTTSYAAALAAGAAAKIVIPNTLAGITGTAVARPSDCSSEGQTGCVTVTNYPSLKLSNVDSAKIRVGTSIVGVAGTIQDCSADAQVLCVAVTGFPSVLKSNITAGVVKNGVTIAGVAGLYPNSTYTLPNATASTSDDLTSATFNTMLKSSGTFEYFDAAGNRYTQAGDTNLAAGNIKNAVTLFGVTGTFTTPGNCSANGQTNCLATSTYQAADTTNLKPENIRRGFSVLNVTGTNYFPDNAADLNTFNRTSGTGASASTTVADFTDSIDDYNNAGALPSTLMGSVPVATAANWIRDPSTDTNGNGICDNSEVCVYNDILTRLKWRFRGVGAAVATQRTACSTFAGGGFDGGRVPTQKEEYQAYIDGLSPYMTALGLAGIDPVWTDTTVSSNTAQAWTFDMKRGIGNPANLSNGYYTLCVIEY